MILASAFTAVTAALLTGPGTYFDEDFADITAATGHAYVVQEYQYRLHLFFLSQRVSAMWAVSQHVACVQQSATYACVG